MKAGLVSVLFQVASVDAANSAVFVYKQLIGLSVKVFQCDRLQRE
jgi:hypothetical protein